MELPERCVDLNEDHIDEGLKSIESMRVLLTHMARIAKPDEGAAKILVAISRIATTACEWLEGKLHVEVDDILGSTEIAVSSDLGGGVRELIFPRLLVDVELQELVRAVKLAPRLVTPLKFRVRGDRMILKRDVEGTVAPPAFEIAEESLRRSLPPQLRRSLPPIDTNILGRIFPRATPTLVIDDANLDVGWDFGAYSSTVNTRETKPPPPAKRPSKIPTHAPPPPSSKPSRVAKPSKLPPKPPKPSKPPAKPAKPSKPPPKPSKPPAKPKKPLIRKVGDAAKDPKSRPKR